jgi:RHS repeat-associated protein
VLQSLTTGAVDGTANYDAFGNLTSQTGQACLLGFQGMIFDASTGTYLPGNGTRVYDPASKTFTTQDPAAQGTNLYEFAANDPTNVTDPTGEGWEPASSWTYLTKEQQAAWEKLYAKGWRLKGSEYREWSGIIYANVIPYAGVGFSWTHNISLDVTDKEMLKLLVAGYDVQWRTGDWAVNFTQKRIWIDASRDKTAAKLIGPLLIALADSIDSGYDVDLLSLKRGAAKNTTDSLRDWIEGNVDELPK